MAVRCSVAEAPAIPGARCEKRASGGSARFVSKDRSFCDHHRSVVAVKYCPEPLIGPGCVVHRYYDPATGQFVSVDPLTNLTKQPYEYASGNPSDRVDPQGESCLPPVLQPHDNPGKFSYETVDVEGQVWNFWVLTTVAQAEYDAYLDGGYNKVARDFVGLLVELWQNLYLDGGAPTQIYNSTWSAAGGYQCPDTYNDVSFVCTVDSVWNFYNSGGGNDLLDFFDYFAQKNGGTGRPVEGTVAWLIGTVAQSEQSQMSAVESLDYVVEVAGVTGML